MKVKRIILFLLLFSPFWGQANFDVDHNCKEAYHKIICLQFAEAQALISTEKKLHPANNFSIYLENLIDFLKIFISEDKTQFDALIENKSQRINQFEDDVSNSPWKRYVIADTYLQWAVVRLKFREYITAAYEVNKAYKLLHENSELYPMFFPNLKGLGVLHAVIGGIPDEYKWVLKLISLQGSITQGLNELTQLLKATKNSEDYNFIYPECLFYLSYVSLHLQGSKKEALQLLPYYNDGGDLIGNSPILAVSKASIYLQNGQSPEAEKTLLGVENSSSIFNFIDYQLGLAKLNQLENDSYKYFFRFLMHFKGENLVKSAYQKIAWYYLINNNSAKYKEYMQLLLLRGVSYAEADKQAQREAQSEQPPHVELLKSRLLFDGGNYAQALITLQALNPAKDLTNVHDLIEYTYRTARVYHEIGKTSLAIMYYERTLKDGGDKPYYFATNAALQLGMIYEGKNDKAKAKEYFQACLNLSPEEYKSSLHQKAKAGLLRLKN
ncbi:MAG: hypothetical protein WCH34_00845 [Bacteroidota bacterium]